MNSGYIVCGKSLWREFCNSIWCSTDYHEMEKSCSLLVHFDKGTPTLANEIKEALEGSDVSAKIDAMKNSIMLLLNGETLPQMFITIVRYVLPSEDHTVQKLLLLYLELINKTDGKGHVLPEMILICQNLRIIFNTPMNISAVPR
ncbi:hypothetical protein ACS0TY_014039 [Phlomoides rotata]